MQLIKTKSEVQITIKLNEAEAKTLWRILQTIPSGTALANTDAEFLKSDLVEIYDNGRLVYDAICNYRSSLYAKLEEALEE